MCSAAFSYYTCSPNPLNTLGPSTLINHIGPEVGTALTYCPAPNPWAAVTWTHCKQKKLGGIFPSFLTELPAPGRFSHVFIRQPDSRANSGLMWIQRHLQICKHERLKTLPIFIAKNRKQLTALKIKKAKSTHFYITDLFQKSKGGNCSPIKQYSVHGHWKFHFSFLSPYCLKQENLMKV